MIKKFLFLLKPNEKKQMYFLFLLMLFMAFLDLLGVVSILPFIAVLTNPSIIEANFVLSTLFQKFNVLGIENNEQFLYILGLLVFFVLVISLVFKAITIYLQLRFVQLCEYNIGKRLLEGYLHQPYSWFINRNSADAGKTILSEVQQVVAHGIQQLLEVIAKGIIVIFLITLLIFIDPKLTFLIISSLGGVYILIYFLARKFLNRIGKERLKNNQSRFMIINEAFGAAKDIKVMKLEKSFIDRFSIAAKKFASNMASAQVVNQLPRFALEIVAFGGILLMTLYLMKQSSNFNEVLPIISLYVFAGYRLMPSLQQIYASLTQLTFVKPSLNRLFNDVSNLKVLEKDICIGDIKFHKQIELKNISFNYLNSTKTVIKNINLTIPNKSTVGFIGRTGSGKTTTVDIILGLLEAQKGILKVDDEIITKKNSKNWQRLLGYVPQHIFLSDDTIAANIAFGINENHINQDNIEKAAKIANLHDFVVNELPEGYLTKVGERGVKLSGGQRQRIGIARAMYRNPKVLIFDEATSALDIDTEKAVMDAVTKLKKDITIILIAHRLNTVKNCDLIFKFEKGEIINQGKLNEITNNLNNK